MAKKNLRVIVNPAVDNAEAIKLLQNYFNVKVIEGVTTSDDLRNFDAVLFSDGPHVDPQYYAEKPSKFTSHDASRDEGDRRIYDLCRRYQKLFIGFGRGAHFLTVMAGGRIIQHVNGHDKNHSVSSNTFASEFVVNSSHTQMMYPYELPSNKYEILAWTKRFQSTTYINGNNQEMDLDEDFLEVEAVYYPNIKAIAIQGNPEAATAGDTFRRFTISVIGDKLKLEN